MGSGTSLDTPTGSMYGSFQLETLHDVSGKAPLAFSARVGRLAMGAGGESLVAPCAETSPSSMLPATSLHVTRRLIVGATVQYVAGAEAGPGAQRHFKYDIQMNNARDHAVLVTAHRWEIIQPDGSVHTVARGDGVGGVQYGVKTRHLAAGDAFRIQGILTTTNALANARGAYTVRLLRKGADAGSEELVDVEVGILGLSVDGEP